MLHLLKIAKGRAMSHVQLSDAIGNAFGSQLIWPRIRCFVNCLTASEPGFGDPWVPLYSCVSFINLSLVPGGEADLPSQRICSCPCFVQKHLKHLSRGSTAHCSRNPAAPGLEVDMGWLTSHPRSKMTCHHPQTKVLTQRHWVPAIGSLLIGSPVLQPTAFTMSN